MSTSIPRICSRRAPPWRTGLVKWIDQESRSPSRASCADSRPCLRSRTRWVCSGLFGGAAVTKAAACGHQSRLTPLITNIWGGRCLIVGCWKWQRIRTREPEVLLSGVAMPLDTRELAWGRLLRPQPDYHRHRAIHSGTDLAHSPQFVLRALAASVAVRRISHPFSLFHLYVSLIADAIAPDEPSGVWLTVP